VAASFTAGGTETLSVSREAGPAGESSEISAVFEAFVFEPEPSRWETSETDRQVERPTERERRSQHVEISVESPALSRVCGTALRVALEVRRGSFDHLLVSKVERMESELRKLSQTELRQIREWLDDMIEDELEFTPQFERSIQRAERDMADGKSARVREPEGS
jgi:hypothetical protein